MTDAARCALLPGRGLGCMFEAGHRPPCAMRFERETCTVGHLGGPCPREAERDAIDALRVSVGPTTRPVVYIAGPIRGKDRPPTAWTRELNIRRAEALALEAWRAGAAVICPHAMGRFYPDDPVEMWLTGDLAILARCDAVLVTSDWRDSTGARLEVDEALRLGIPVLDSIGDLISRLDDLKALVR